MAITLQSCLTRAVFQRTTHYPNYFRTYQSSHFRSLLYIPSTHFAIPGLTTRIRSFSPSNDQKIFCTFPKRQEYIIEFLKQEHFATKALDPAILSSLADKLANRQNIPLDTLNEIIFEVLEECNVGASGSLIIKDRSNRIHKVSYSPIFWRILRATTDLGHYEKPMKDPAERPSHTNN